MSWFSAIFFLLLSWWVPPPEPTVLRSLPHGIFPSYGFDQNDSEKIAPILNLIHTGAYKVEEEDYGYYKKGRGDTNRYIYKISLSKSGDSVTVEEYPADKSAKFYEIYLLNGKLIYSCSLSKDSSIEKLRFLDLTRNVWLNFHSDKKTRFDGVTKDSFALDDGMIFDKLGRPIEYDKKGYLGKITSKTFYKYDAYHNETEEIEYIMIDTMHRLEHPRFIRTQDSILKAQYAMQVREWRKEYEKWEEAYKLVKEEYKLSRKTFIKYDSIERKQETFKYEYTEKDSTLTDHSIIYYDQYHRQTMRNVMVQSGLEFPELRKYTEDSLGHFIGSSFYLNGEESDSSIWEYNKQGLCISYQLNIPPDKIYSTDTWTYDSKGNIIQYLESFNGEPSYTNNFKIYYK